MSWRRLLGGADDADGTGIRRERADERGDDGGGETGAAASRLIALLDEGAGLLERERAHCVRGEVAALGPLAEEKAAFLARLERAMASTPLRPGSLALQAATMALRRLQRLARRNEALIAAAERGVRAARRRLAAIGATRSGRVAYAADGGAVISRADAAGRTRRA